jgi:hypothetical protein
VLWTHKTRNWFWLHFTLYLAWLACYSLDTFYQVLC